ncbi:MAG: hypothetical protein QOF00_2666 [Pseudonocardiales bacterium]|jgi:LysM repeat protein|nr:hypothetical protein [Pseudonocardiales bacterium]
MREETENGRARSGTASVGGAPVGGPSVGHRSGVLTLVPGTGGPRSRTTHRPGPRRSPGPRPVRPGVVAVAVRPAQVERPLCHGVPQRPGQRVLARRPVVAAPPLALRYRVRRAVAGVVVALVAAAVVVGLGLLADAASVVRAAGTPSPGVVAAAPAEIIVTVAAGDSLGAIAERAVPGATGAELSAVVERIVTANSLTSVQVRPGQVLRVPVG